MGLYRNHKHEVPAGAGDVQRIVDGSYQVAVPHPSAFVYIVLGIHVLLGDEAEISQSGEYRTAGVEVGLIVMDGGGPVAQSIQFIRGTVADPLGEDRLVGQLPGTEIAQAHARLDGKFRIDGTGSHHRHLKVSGGVFFRQLMPVGQRILAEVQPVDTGRIEEGLQLHHDDVGLDLHIGGVVIDLVHQLLHRFLGIAAGLTDAGIQHRHRETVRESVFLIAVGQVVKVVVQDIGPQKQDRQSVERNERHDHKGNIQPVFDLLLVFRRVPKGPDKPDDDEEKNDAEQRHFHVGPVLGKNGQTLLNGAHVLSGERCDAACQDQSVHRSHEKPDEADEDPGKAPAPRQEHQCQRQVDHEGVVQVDLLVRQHKHRSISQRMPGHGFDEKIQDEGQDEMIDKGILI